MTPNTPDWLIPWLREDTIDDPEAITPRDVLYDSYASWCERNGRTPKTKRQFSYAMGDAGYLWRYEGKGSRVSLRVGIRLRPEPAATPTDKGDESAALKARIADLERQLKAAETELRIRRSVMAEARDLLA